MTDDEHLAVEVAQFLQHVHDIADLLAGRMDGLRQAKAEALLEQELPRLAVLAKQLEAKSGIPEIASSVGYKISAVIRTGSGAGDLGAHGRRLGERGCLRAPPAPRPRN